MLQKSLLHFFKMESSTGILLMIATVLAMAMANSPLKEVYGDLMQTPVVVSVGTFIIAKPLLLWINDGLMAIFFFMVGLEIKRETVEGALRDRTKIAVPLFAAIGGMAIPALIFLFFNHGNSAAMQGWAIPAATDIAFALGILSLLGSRVPAGLKLFLLTLAIIDDLGAIIIIALFYTNELSLNSLLIALFMILILWYMNKKGVINNTAYILIGIVLWLAVLKSGVHATLAGVVLGLFMPIRNNSKSFRELESSLHAPVNFVILPIFAFANAGVSFGNVTLNDVTDNLTLGIAFGLFLGKQLGIFLFSYMAVFFRLGKLPDGVDWHLIYGVAILGGIGFTMSLFVGSLAFECSGEACYDLVDERMGIIFGSLLSGVIGYLYLRFALQRSMRHG